MKDWKIVVHSNTQQAGPATAMEALIAELEEAGTEYIAYDYTMDEAVPTRTKKVAGKELEVR